jgi:hypothetical protein
MITTTITPQIDFTSGSIRLDEVTDDSMGLEGLTARFHTTIIRTRDQATRAALIRLGWTPPAPEQRLADAPTSDITRSRVRAHDPASSVLAAEGAARFADPHRERILRALRDDELSSHQIAKLSGLTVVQCDRRLPELQREGVIEVVTIDGEEVMRAGYRVWRRIRTSGN